MSSIIYDEELVVVHIIDADNQNKKEVPIPDFKANKPLGFHDQKDGSFTFFQKLINTEVDGAKISISAPDEISLSLSIFEKSKKSSAELRKVILSHAENSNGSIFGENVKDTYDFLEEIQKSIIFSYKAIEAFCNATIPDEYIYIKKNGKGIDEHYGKAQIERWISTSEKVSEILPKILSVDSPIKEKFLSDFKSLERVRNEIIHSKSSTSASVLSELFP